jgi:CRISPR-associated endonuclease/helicase Cas3
MKLAIEQIDKYFKDLTGFKKPHNFQIETIQNILEHKNTILKAPTGSGKTEPAIAPFIIALFLIMMKENCNFPNKLIYAVPLRTLANSLRERTKKLLDCWSKKYQLPREIVVTLQTGENPEDPRFEGDIIFCTIDQMLSSFLNIPYSVGRGSANVNAGAIFSSYLVFDELHLLDPDRSFATVLKVLEQAKGISPFLLMTATLTQELVDEIKSVVGNDVEEIIVKEDLLEIEGKRCRIFEAREEPLSAELILKDIEERDRKRVIVICNTVSVSQGLFRDLEALIDKNKIEITLLHSRFLPGDRKKKESNLETLFGKEWKKHDDGKCHVLISTQVIEVGINITSEVMHVQLCPMSSLLQRAGRCARFQGETGEVRVYENVEIEENNQELAKADTEDTEAELIDKQPEKKRRFLPYNNDVCLKTWEVLEKHNSREKVDFEIEDRWIQQVHHEESELQKKRRQNNRLEFENKFRDAIFEGDRSTARQLIRFVDNRTIYLGEDNPIINFEEEQVDLQNLPVFSVPKTSLLKAWRDFKKAGHQTWLFKRVENPQGDKAETYSKLIATKIEPPGEAEIIASFRLIINRQYVSYSKDIGLEINVNNPPEQKEDIPKPDRSQQPYKDEYEYYMDTYTQHLKMMWDCWHNKFPPDSSKEKIIYTSIKDELLKAGGRFIKEKIFTEATKEDAEALFELLVMFAILTHDLGKLQVKWQSVMRGWQQLAYDKFKDHPDFRPSDPKFHLLAHTDHKESVDEEEYKAYMKQHKRPPHAVESAFLAEELLESHLQPILMTSFNADEEQINNIFGVIQMAAGRHHSAWAKGWKLSDVAKNETLELVENANQEITKSWQMLSQRINLPHSITLPSESFELKQTSYPAATIDLNIFDPDSLEYQQLYALVVRALRICDMRSVQLT